MTFAEWRGQARSMLVENVHPASAFFADSLFPTAPDRGPSDTTISVPKRFLELAGTVAMHRDARRWDLLYRVLYRIARGGERNLLEIEVDPDVRELTLMRAAVSRDIHKMHAFVRFRKIEGTSDQYVAWYQPDHLIVEHVGPWFARRFGAMHWAILTPDRSVYWDTHILRFGPGLPRSEAPRADALEDLWKSYYASIFNPARLNVDAMVKELPVRHWATLPEAELIPRLIVDAAGREGMMRSQNKPTAEPFVPPDHSLPVLATAVRECRGCDLYKHATQAVFGEGRSHARVMLVGEQPGDQEDLQGHPFIGPAGRLLDRALEEAHIDRKQVYVTNAVKHFKFEERGKRRIHKKPGGIEIAACRPWLTAEIEDVDPRVIVALGATAALSVGGREFAIQKERGKLLKLSSGRDFLVTVHPSFLLRMRDTDRDAEFDRFVADLRLIA